MRTPIRPLLVLALVLLGLSFLACAQEPADEAEAAVPSAAAESTQTYDLEIEIRGLIGYVPVGANGETVGAGETARTLWGVFVNATNPQKEKPPCVERAPYAKDTRYHEHFPRLHFSERYLVDAPGDELWVEDGTVKKDLKGFHLELENEALADSGVELAGPREEPCTPMNAESFHCIPRIRDVVTTQAEICSECLDPIADDQPFDNEFVAARFAFDNGRLISGPLETNNEGELKVYSFADTGAFQPEPGEKEETWQWMAEREFPRQPLAESQILRICGLRGPLTVRFTRFNDGSESTLRLDPKGGPTMRLQVLNLTCAGVGKCNWIRRAEYEGREFRWFYNLSAQRPAECSSPTDPPLPSLVTWNDDFSPPICPQAVFEAPSTQ